MAQSTIIQTNLPSFPWNVGDPLDAVPLNNAFIQLHQLIDNLQNQINVLDEHVTTNNLAVALVINFGGNTSPSVGPYEILATAPYEFSIINMEFSVGNAGGSFTFTLLDNGVPIPGLQDIVVDQFTRQMVLADGVNVILRGSEVIMQISNLIGFPQNSWVQINGTTNQVPEQVFGVTQGFATGVSGAFAVGTSALTGQGVMSTSGTSTALAIGMAADRARGQASGTSTANGVIVQVMFGNTTASAFGTSTALAVGATSVPFPTLVLDDPADGVLNENPLG